MVYRVGDKQPVPVEREVSERDRRAIDLACRRAVPGPLAPARRVRWTLRNLTVRIYVDKPVDPAALDGEWVSHGVARLTYIPEQAAWTTTYAAGKKWRSAPALMGSLGLVLRTTLAHQADLIARD